ncbi:acyltransferase family protein [Cytobacillus firmus]|uniref:acyltransferase family protein n=1 Tax=Cytobacillus firmus TaxID=1399 RepID=UPI002030C2D4|nr:acyltransferase family protein [Cytobacillus firmus]URT70206.1 acyltransferase family protein [Cytobacillus firmus]
MNNNSTINSVFWLRAIACIAVVMGHSIQLTNVEFKHLSNDFYSLFLNYLLAAGLFGTPIFVFISELLLSKKYPVQLPKGFFRKRFGYILLPYIFMNIIYAIIEVKRISIETILLEIVKNIFLGHSVLYFVLIIFQFYFLHVKLNKFLNRFSPSVVLPLALLVNVIYLGIFNFTNPPNFFIAQEIWRFGYWLPFIGWVFYFSLGFYCGKYFNEFLSLIIKNKYIILLLPVFTFLLFVIINKYNLINFTNSKRIDMVLYTTSVIFLIILFTTIFIKKVPKIIMIISNYSFCIYLMHMLFIHLIELASPPMFFNKLSYLIIVLITSITCSILSAHIFNKAAFGKYLIGNVNRYKSDTHRQIRQKKVTEIV